MPKHNYKFYSATLIPARGSLLRTLRLNESVILRGQLPQIHAAALHAGIKVTTRVLYLVDPDIESATKVAIVTRIDNGPVAVVPDKPGSRPRGRRRGGKNRPKTFGTQA